VLKAYEKLKDEGYVESHIGSATRVSARLPRVAHLPVPDQSNNAPPRNQVLSEYGKRLSTGKPLYSASAGKTLPGSSMDDGGGGKDLIQFHTWRLARDFAPLRHFNTFLNRWGREQDDTVLDYPADPQGFEPLREMIARSLFRSRGIKCGDDQILIVSGLAQAIGLVARLHIERGDWVALEDPCYAPLRKTFALEGATCIPISVDDQGIDVEKLVQLDRRIRFAYLTPSHQYPTGAVLSAERRMALLDWAHQTGTLLIEDEHDSEFRHVGEPIPALKAMDERGSVIFIGTFAKVLFPAIGIAYLVLPRDLVRCYTNAREYMGEQAPIMIQRALAEFMQRGYLRSHVRRMRAIYKHKREVLLGAIERYLGDRAQVSGDTSGIHCLLNVESNLSEEDIVAMAAKSAVMVTGTANLYVEPDPSRKEFVLGYGDLTDEQIEEGVRRLSILIKDA
jgi:GntR family transcriptional regulator/MocR family aminotransferase